MLVFIGDIHTAFDTLKLIQNKYEGRDATFIQVGDFGYWPFSRYREAWDRAQITRPVYFIDGNHDHNPSLFRLAEGSNGPVETWPNAFYVPRGTVLTLDNKRIGFLGGAGSVDYKWRALNVDWFKEEQIREEDVNKLLSQKPVDILVVHTPPKSCIDANFDPAVLENFFNLPRTWTDPSSLKVEHVWKELGLPPLICGHMHRSLKWHGVQILNINETLEV